MNELVSVIITTYKRNDLLPRAIDSVLHQSYPHVEVVVVDDNDPDSDYRNATEQLIAGQYLGKCNLQYIKMPCNSGACAARNAGVAAAKGTYINFLDDDDELLPTKLEKQMVLFERSPQLSVVGCFAEIVDEFAQIKGYERTQIRGNVFFNQLCHNLTTTSLSLIRKDVYLQSGGFEQMHSSQEHWMFAKIYAINPNYDFVPEELVRLYHHSGERISTNRNKPLGAIELSQKVEIFYNNLDKNQQEVLKGCMQENIIFAFLNIKDKENAKVYYRQYRRNKAIPFLNKLKVGLMCAVGMERYRKLLALRRNRGNK